MSYDTNNIFARILRGEIPATVVYEDDWALAFQDIFPKAPVHLLVIPKGPYTSFEDFVLRATPAESAGFFKAVGTVIQRAGIAQSGYRLITNTGTHGHQEVPHFHVHVLGGAFLGPMLSPKVSH